MKLKVNIVLALLSPLFGALIGYTFSCCGAELFLSLLSGFFTAILLLFGMAITVEGAPRASLLLRISSWAFLIISLLLHRLLVLFSASLPLSIILKGALLLIIIGVLYQVGTLRH